MSEPSKKRARVAGPPSVVHRAKDEPGRKYFERDFKNRKAVVAKWQEWFDNYSSPSTALNKILEYEWSSLTDDTRDDWARRQGDAHPRQLDGPASPSATSLVTPKRKGTLEQRRTLFRAAFDKVFNESPELDVNDLVWRAMDMYVYEFTMA